MKKMYKLKKLIDYNSSIFPRIEQLENATDNEWYVVLKDYFNDEIELNYSDRIINKLIDENGISILFDYVQRKIRHKVLTNIYKYSKLYETTILEYNPLWNVDGTEEHTISIVKNGNTTDTYNDSIKSDHTGNDTISKTGTIIIEKDGDDTINKTGTSTNAKSGNDTLNKTGTSTNVKSGNDTLNKTGTITDIEQKTTFDSTSFYDTQKNTTSNNLSDTTLYNNSDTLTNNLSDTTIYNTNDTLTNNLSDTTIYNSNETTENDLTDTTLYNSSNTNKHTGTKDVDFSENENHTERLTRQGNIGVTKSTDLIDSQRITVNYSYIENVVHDIINSFTILVD